MAEQKKKEIAQAYVRIYPIIEGLAKMMGQQMKDAQNSVESKSKKMGRQIANSLNEGLKMVNASGLTQTLATGVSQGFRGIAGAALNTFKSIGGTAIRTLGGAFRSAGALLNTTLVNSAKTTALAIGGVLATGVGFSVGKGFSRALTTTEAKAKMKGLGYEGKNLEAIMKSASDAVDGLAFSTGDAATAASGLLASGVKPGEDLTRVLRSIGDTASLTGREFSDISSIYGKVFASGIIQGEELNQLMDSGVPILQYLSKSMKVATADVKKMASQGKISSADFAKAMEENLGGVGERMASASFSLSARNVASQAGRIFEPLFTTALESAIPVLGKIRTKLKDFVAFLAPVLAPIQKNIQSAFEKAGNAVERFNIGSVFTRVSTTIERFKELILPISGLILGMSGSLLQSIPVIGNLFSGITGPVGLLAGFLATIFMNSESLRKSFGRLADSLGNFLSKIFNVQMDKFDIGGIFEMMGDGLANGIDNLSNIIDTKAGNLGGVVSKMWAGIVNPQTIETLKTGAGEIFKAIGDVFSSVFTVLVEVATDPRVRLAGAQIVEAFGSVFGAFAQVGQKNNIESIASTIASTIAIAASIISNAIILIADIVKGIVKITSTPAFASFAAWMKGVAQVIVQSSGFLKGALIALATAFVGFKVFKLFGKIQSFLPSGSGSSGKGFGKKISDMMKGLGKGVAAAFRAIPGIAQAFVSAAPHLMAAIGVAALILLELGTLGHILKALKVGEGLAKLGEVLGSFAGAIMTILEVLVSGIVQILTTNAPIVAAALTAVFYALKPILNFVVEILKFAVTTIVTLLRDFLLPFLTTFVQSLGEIFNGVANIFMSLGTAIYLILNGIATVLQTVFTGISTILLSFAVSVGSIISSLTSGGFEAAAAAMALAAGITALNLAMAGGTLLNAGANFGAGLLNIGKGISDKLSGIKDNKINIDESSALGQIMQLVNALQSASDIISTLKTNWEIVAQQAFSVGATIISNLAMGITNNQMILNSSLSNAIDNMLASAQGKLDANPLQVRVNMPSELSAAGVGSMNYNGQTSNTQNNEFNISNPNPFVVANAISNMMK